MPDEVVRTRFAPSPTGLMHIGNARTALVAWLFARRAGGRFLLRIEDTDPERSSPFYEEAILRDLRWLGLDWDEGVGAGGEYGPYRQSQRLDLYARYARKLLESGWAYYCYCTAAELAEQKESALARGLPPRYDGRCRQLTEEKRRELEREGRRPVLRFRTPPGEEIVVEDLIKGRLVFASADLDDFVLLRPDGRPLYNFAAAVDDALMRITHVIRGEEHLSNTPRQILLCRALGLPVPRFAHLGVLLGPDRRKLSKRTGAASLADLREHGYLPEAVLNYLALLGWSPPGGEEVMRREELLQSFALEKLGSGPAVFDRQRLDWFNGQYLRALSREELVGRSLPFLQAAGLVGTPPSAEERERVERVMAVLQPELTVLAEVAAKAKPFLQVPSPQEWEAEAQQELAHPQTRLVLAEAREALQQAADDFSPEAIRSALHRLPPRLGLGKGRVFRPLRAALTGRLSGPELHLLVWALGREDAVARLERGLKELKREANSP
ncbi:MAG: glutamate--tRNA ligase [Bacillota bacterium]|nr:glutamate--tRNA ligase [Bacillota bacterium]